MSKFKFPWNYNRFGPTDPQCKGRRSILKNPLMADWREAYWFKRFNPGVATIFCDKCKLYHYTNERSDEMRRYQKSLKENKGRQRRRNVNKHEGRIK